MADFFGLIIAIVVIAVIGIVLLWAVLEMLDLMGYVFPGKKKKKFFDE